MDPAEGEPELNVELSLTEFRLAFHQIHMQLGLPDPLT